MGFWSIAAPIIGSVIGAVGQRQQAKAMQNAGQLDLGKLREEAIANGFNPVGVLQATGGAGFQKSGEVPGFLSFLAGQVPGMMSDLGTAKRWNDGKAQRDADLAHTQSATSLNNAMEAETIARMGAPSATREEEDYMAMYKANPEGFSPVINMEGQTRWVKNKILYRLEIEPNTLYGIGEDYEALYGEIGGQAGGMANTANEALNTVGGWLGFDTDPHVLREDPNRPKPGGLAPDPYKTVIREKKLAPASLDTDFWNSYNGVFGYGG